MKELRALTDRATRASAEDGLQECVLAVLFIGLGAGLLIAQIPSPYTSPVPFLWMLLPLAPVIWLNRTMVPRWKAALTVPRIGHVEPPTASRRRLALLATAALGISLSMVALRALGNASDSNSVGVATALLLAGASAYGAIRWGLIHLLALSAVALMFAGWTYKTAATAASTPWLLVVLGFILGVSGIVRLLRFLATHPVRADGDAE
jgi:hypothetical protein